MRYKLWLWIIFLITFYSITFAQSSGAWVTIDSLLEARVGHAIVVLPNGNILVSGGEGGYVNSRKASSEIYDLTTSKWRYTAPMNIKRFLHNLVLLKTGKILAIGGYAERSCELFDPVTETWTMTDSIPTMRFDGQSITELKDGRILVSGGFRTSNVANSAEYLSICEIYDPVTEKWLPAAPLYVGRYNHTATLLNSGEVIIAGGSTKTVGALRSCEIYNPTNNTWSITTSLNEPRSNAASILLPNGNVFISGGDSTGVNIIPWKKSCEVFENNIGKKWFYVENMIDRRIGHQIYYLAKTNQLLIIGGAIMQQSVEDTWETYDPINLRPLQYGIFPLKKIFSRRNTVKLKDDRIIIAGGVEYDFSVWGGMPYAWTSKSCQLFDILTSVEESKLIPDGYILFQNYPNPFNPTTKISFSIPQKSQIKLKVFDVLGREVATLAEGVYEAGKYEVNFDAGNLPSGVYFYNLVTEKNSITKKMLLLR